MAATCGAPSGAGRRGNQKVEPIKKVELKGKEKITSLSRSRRQCTQRGKADRIPIRIDDPGPDPLPPSSQAGAMEGIPTSDSRGIRAGGRRWNRRGTGIGPGQGFGLGPGWGWGFGGGAYKPRNGVMTPSLQK